MPKCIYICRAVLKSSGSPGLTKVRLNSPCPSSAPRGLPELRLMSHCLHLPVIFDITALLPGISGYLVYPEWVVWYFLKDRYAVQNQTQMSGSDHTAGKGIIPSALKYQDVPRWKHHHGGLTAGPGDTYQESLVDWLWIRPWAIPRAALTPWHWCRH